MDTKMFLSLVNDFCKGIIPTQCMTQHVREAKNLIWNNIHNIVIISEDQVHDLERSCDILQEYLKTNRRGRFALDYAVKELEDVLEKRRLSPEESIVRDYNRRSTLDLIRWT